MMGTTTKMYRNADIRVRYIHEYTTVRLLSLKLHVVHHTRYSRAHPRPDYARVVGPQRHKLFTRY